MLINQNYELVRVESKGFILKIDITIITDEVRNSNELLSAGL